MYSRLDYARRVLSNFPMSHTGESVSGKLIHARTPTRPEGEKERDLVWWSMGGDTEPIIIVLGNGPEFPYQSTIICINIPSGCDG